MSFVNLNFNCIMNYLSYRLVVLWYGFDGAVACCYMFAKFSVLVKFAWTCCMVIVIDFFSFLRVIGIRE